MTEVLLFVNIGLLVIGSVTLTIAIFVLQKARGYVDLAEERMERLREGQERIFQFLREERRSHSEEPVREERAAEPKVEELEKELQKLRQNQNNKLLEQNASSLSGTRHKGPPKNVGLLAGEDPESDETRANAKIPSTEAHETASAAPTQKTPESKKAGFAVKHAHPDDDVSLRRESVEQDGSQGGAPVKMFREHYHRYLENYEGYVKLAERLCQMREEGEVPSGSPSEREWEQKLRRLNDGIQRTTARLDILEQYNPELASDDRVSHRAEISRSYSELEEKLSSPENS
ncbi:MAG: hypothetical protein WA982_02565 [Rubrobacteraceae bacterium]